MNKCFETEIAGFAIELWQRSDLTFDVHYGLQVDESLDYSTAAARLGQCIMHALACESKLDNRLVFDTEYPEDDEVHCDCDQYRSQEEQEVEDESTLRIVEDILANR